MLPAPNLMPIDNADGGSDYVLRWSAVEDAVWYLAEGQLNSGEWKRSGEINDTSLDIYQPEEGTACYRVAAYNFEMNSTWSNEECVLVGGVKVYMPLVMYVGES